MHKSAFADDIDLLGKLDNAIEHENDAKQRLDAKHKIINMLVKCEFDEQCELNMIPDLEVITKTDKNLVYRGFLTYLKWEKSDLEFQVKHCQINEKRAVRKVFAQCYANWVNDEINHPPQSPDEIDKQEHQRYICLKNNMDPLATQGNIFAQAEMVNVFEYLRDPKSLDLWSAKVLSQKGSAKFDKFMRCHELP
jgi:hypothetical protein